MHAIGCIALGGTQVIALTDQDIVVRPLWSTELPESVLSIPRYRSKPLHTR